MIRQCGPILVPLGGYIGVNFVPRLGIYGRVCFNEAKHVGWDPISAKCR